MAWISGLTDMILDGGVLGSRQFIVSGAPSDSGAGTSVEIFIENIPSGATPPGEPDTFELIVQLPGTTTTIRTYTLSNSAPSQTVTFFFTANGQSGGGNRCGTVEMVLRAVKTTGGPTATYNIRSDSETSTPPVGFTFTVNAQGYWRGTTTIVNTVSNVAFGGAIPDPFAYDDSIFARLLLGATPYDSQTISLIIETSPAGVDQLTQAIASATTTFQNQFTNVVDDRFAASNSAYRLAGAISLHSLTGAAWTLITGGGLTGTAFNLDPRITAAQHFQVNEQTYNPLSDSPEHTILGANESGFIFVILTNARGERKSGITVSFVLDPQNPGSNVTGSFASTTHTGEAGVAGPLEWTSSKPDGAWLLALDITSPADIDNNAHLVGTTGTYFLIAGNPNIVAISGSSGFGDQSDHFRPGFDLFFIGFTLFDTLNQVTVIPDEVPNVHIYRFNFTFLILESLTSIYEWVSAASVVVTPDHTADIFTAVGHVFTADQNVQIQSDAVGSIPTGLEVETDYFVRDVTADTFKLAASAGGAVVPFTSNGTGTVVVAPRADNHVLGPTSDPNVFALLIPTSATGDGEWTTDDLFTVATGKRNGSPYPGPTIQLIAGDSNRHSGYVLDPIGLAVKGLGYK